MRSGRSLFHLPLLAMVAVAVLTSASTAAASPDDSPTAEVLFEEGRVLLERGAYVEACAKFAESRRLERQVGVTLYLAECYERAGQFASAWVTFRAAVDDATRAGDARSAIAEKRAAKLEPRLARLVVSAGDGAGTAGLTIKKDDEEIRSAQWGVAVPVDPGTHHINAQAPGKKPWHREIAIAGEGTIVTVTVPKLEDAPPPPRSPEGGAGAAPVVVTSPTRTLGIVGMGVGAVALAVGATFGALTFERASELESRCSTYPQCNSSDRDALTAIDDDARTFGTISTVGFVAGGALVVAGAVLFFTSPSGTRAIAPSARGVAIRW